MASGKHETLGKSEGLLEAYCILVRTSARTDPESAEEPGTVTTLSAQKRR